VDLTLGHHAQDGIEVIDVQGEIDMYTAPRLRELLIDLAVTGSCQLVVNLDKVGFLDSTGLGVMVGGLKRVRARDGSLDLVCTQPRILCIIRRECRCHSQRTASEPRLLTCPANECLRHAHPGAGMLTVAAPSGTVRHSAAVTDRGGRANIWRAM
jgi:anti-sigma B factor antagonist